MRSDQFQALAQLARLKHGGKARYGAFLTMVDGKTQIEAAQQAGCKQSTVSAAVRRIKEAQRLIRRSQ